MRSRLLLLLLSATIMPAVAVTEPLRVICLNVRTPIDTAPQRRWEARREAMAELLRAQRPDVVATQELVREQGDYLVAQLPGWRWLGRGRQGNGADDDEHMGVLYDARRLEVVESGDFWLSDTPEVAGSISWGNLYPRMVTWALFERRSDRRRFYLLDTHLPYRDQDEQARRRGAALIRQWLARLPADVPVVLAGDFNSEPGGGAYHELVPPLADARLAAARHEGPRATFHDFSGLATRQLDWILVRGLRVQRLTTLNERPQGVWPSDHFPVLAELTWP